MLSSLPPDRYAHVVSTHRDLDAAREKEERLRSRIKTVARNSNSTSRRSSSRRVGESKASSDPEDDDHDDDDDDARDGSAASADDGDRDHNGNRRDGGGGGGGGKRRRVNELEKRVQVGAFWGDLAPRSFGVRGGACRILTPLRLNFSGANSDLRCELGLFHLLHPNYCGWVVFRLKFGDGHGFSQLGKNHEVLSGAYICCSS